MYFEVIELGSYCKLTVLSLQTKSQEDWTQCSVDGKFSFVFSHWTFTIYVGLKIAEKIVTNRSLALTTMAFAANVSYLEDGWNCFGLLVAWVTATQKDEFTIHRKPKIIPLQTFLLEDGLNCLGLPVVWVMVTQKDEFTIWQKTKDNSTSSIRNTCCN